MRALRGPQYCRLTAQAELTVPPQQLAQVCVDISELLLNGYQLKPPWANAYIRYALFEYDMHQPWPARAE
jgi:hypothetical protein